MKRIFEIRAINYNWKMANHNELFLNNRLK